MAKTCQITQREKANGVDSEIDDDLLSINVEDSMKATMKIEQRDKP